VSKRLNKEDIDISKLELASSKSRMKAFIIDDLLISLITMFLLWDSMKGTNGDILAMVKIMNGALLQIMFIKVIYQSFFIWYYGATLGKMLVKIRVIDFNNFSKVTLVQAIARSFIRIISESIFYIGFMLSFYSKSKQTLHDKLAKTLVVNV
jgi:uncharacterized RDD family membrane protein YckC